MEKRAKAYGSNENHWYPAVGTDTEYMYDFSAQIGKENMNEMSVY